jgi:hypothetical protein
MGLQNDIGCAAKKAFTRPRSVGRLATNGQSRGSPSYGLLRVLFLDVSENVTRQRRSRWIYTFRVLTFVLVTFVLGCCNCQLFVCWFVLINRLFPFVTEVLHL